MSDCYIGEIRYFTYRRGAPEGWLACDGSVQQLAQYATLGMLLGTTYGGDGQTTFGLPDLRGRLAIGTSGSYPLGEMIGTEEVALSLAELPTHTHAFQTNTAAATHTDPTGNILAAGATGVQIYYAPTPPPTAVAMNQAMIGVTGGGQPHGNCAQTLALLPCIACEGAFPPKNT